MGSRKPDAKNVYAAAEKWVDCALHKSDSLFTPGKPIWTRELLGQLRECYLDNPDTSKRNFYMKLEDQLSGRSPEVYQLMVEVLYVHFLFIWRDGMRSDTKIRHINETLKWSGQQITIPDDLVAGLTPGIARIGAAYSSLLPFMVGFLIEFVDQWKEREQGERQRLLNDPWAFKDFIVQLELQGELFRERPYSHWPQLEALLHLVHPDTFEATVSADHKKKIAEANAFAHFVTEEIPDVDRKLAHIRRGLESQLGRDFDFYHGDIYTQWNSDTSSSTPWDEFIGHAKAMVDAGIIDIEGEKNSKYGIGEKLAVAREAVLKSAPEWPQLLKAGLTGFEYHPLPWQVSDRFRVWIIESPDNVKALQAFWAEGDLSVIDRIRPFSGVLPRGVASRPGIFTNLTSVLMMGLDAEQYPPFKIIAFTEAYKRTGYDMPERGADEAALYEHALGFLDRLIEEASKRGLTLRHHLDAQTIAYRTVVASLSEPPVEGEDVPPETSPPPPIDLTSLAAKLYLPVNFLENIGELLTDKKQIIFQGPPGTGKTYVAQALAKHLAGSEERVTLVQFHPSYAYEDFVRGFRPTLTEDGQAGFDLKDGPLLQAAKRAEGEPDADHFLIIDEINRGNLAKVFGELYFLLEYRDEKITLQYQRDEDEKKFSLPPNLYIIGTMNTADRSIALVDLALRRRFYFVEFHPDEEPVKGVLRRWLESNHPDMTWVAGVVEEANKLLETDRHAAIGPSYFMKDELDEDVVERIWKHSVLPYIEERRFGGEEVSDEFDLDRLRRASAQADANSANGEDDVENEDGGGNDASN